METCKLKVHNIAYQTVTIPAATSNSNQKVFARSLPRLTDPAGIKKLVLNDNDSNHSIIDLILDLVQRLESVMLTSQNHIYKISMTMITKSTVRSIQRRAYDILIKSLDGPLNTQFGLELVLGELDSQGGDEEYLQIIMRVFTILHVQRIEMLGPTISADISAVVQTKMHEVEKNATDDCYIKHLLTIIKAQITNIHGNVSFKAPIPITESVSDSSFGLQECINILADGHINYPPEFVLSIFADVNQTGNIYAGIKMVQALVTSLTRPLVATRTILQIFIPLFKINATWGLEAFICLSTLCVDSQVTMQKAIVKFLEKALKNDDALCRYGAALGFHIISSKVDSVIGNFAQKLVLGLDKPTQRQIEHRNSKLFIFATRRVYEIQSERRSKDKSEIKFFKMTKINPVTNIND